MTQSSTDANNTDSQSPLATQVGGQHYKCMAIQPVEYIHKNGIGFVEGAVIKYVSRWRSKNGIEDLRKARHMLDLLIELETQTHQEPQTNCKPGQIAFLEPNQVIVPNLYD